MHSQPTTRRNQPTTRTNNMSSLPIEINTDLIDNSDKRDLDYTNMANSLFNDILHRIRCSNLNFQLQISPFSAHVSLKKTFIRDKLGNMLPPSASVLPVDDKYLRNLEYQNKLLLKGKFSGKRSFLSWKYRCIGVPVRCWFYIYFKIEREISFKSFKLYSLLLSEIFEKFLISMLIAVEIIINLWNISINS